MIHWKGLFRLMRFHKPVGIVLLWIPTAWALWIANHGAPSWSLFVLFFMGTVLMRALGCVVNDFADRHLDKHVKRTSNRPLASGEISVVEAFMCAGVLSISALWVVLQLPLNCFYYAIVALAVTVLYPFCKRFFVAPQLVLGLAFSMGIPMAYAASQVPFTLEMGLLFILNVAWIVAYDTMYAMADRAEDRLIGIKSTAILWGRHDRIIIAGLQVFFSGSWLILGGMMHASMAFYGCWMAGIVVVLYQQRLIQNRVPAACLKAFSSNMVYGLWMWLGLIVVT